MSDRLKKAEQIIYGYQRGRLEEVYADIGGLDDVRSFFFEMIYPAPGDREKFKRRNEAFGRMVKNPLIRLVCSKPVIRTLERARELEALTNRLDSLMAQELAAIDPIPDPIEEALYFELSRRVSTKEQRMRQLDYAVDGFMLGIGVVSHLPLSLDQIVKIVPRALFVNKEIYDLAIETYHVFYNHKGDLEAYLELMRKRESNHINRMFAEAT